MRQPQIGVTLTEDQRLKLEKAAQEQGRSLSAVCAEAIEAYTDSWINRRLVEKDTGFSVVKRVASQMAARQKGVSKRA